MTKPALIPPSRGLNIKLSIWAAAWFGIVLAVLLHLFNDSVTSVLYQFSPIVEAFDIVLPPKENVIKEAKPPHCRPDLPGCVPRVVENIFFLHVPKVINLLQVLERALVIYPFSLAINSKLTADRRNLGPLLSLGKLAATSCILHFYSMRCSQSRF